MLTLVVWIVMPRGLVCKYQRFRMSILLQSSALDLEAVCSSETLISFKSQHDVTAQKTNIDIPTAVRTQNLKEI
jgi:hypothetical protein